MKKAVQTRELKRFLPSWFISILSTFFPDILSIIFNHFIKPKESDLVFCIKIHKSYMGEFIGYCRNTHSLNSVKNVRFAMVFLTAESANDALNYIDKLQSGKDKYSLFVEPVILRTIDKKTAPISFGELGINELESDSISGLSGIPSIKNMSERGIRFS